MLHIRNVGLVLAAFLVAGLVLAQPPGSGQPPKKDTPEKKPATLEEMLAKGLKDNPDIRVAEAKLHEAEAELNRTRLAVAQKVIAAVTALEKARKVAEEAEERSRMVQKLAERKQASTEEVRIAMLALAQAKAEVAKLEAELPLLFGRISDRDDGPGLKTGGAPEGSGGFSGGRGFSGGGGIGGGGGFSGGGGIGGGGGFSGGSGGLGTNRAAPPKPAISGPMAEKIRKALDQEVRIELEKGTSLEEVRNHLLQAYDLPFALRLLDVENEKIPHPLRLSKKVPLGAALQAMEDTFPEIRFVVREYGILGARVKDLPPDAVRVIDFWRDGKETPARVSAEGLNPPKEAIEGTVTLVEKDTGLIKISVGSDKGLKEGHTLEVFRVKPAAKYLGTLRIVEVTPKESVGKMLGRPTNAVEVGDQVASRIAEK